MGIIQTLDEHLANQISAGEVVERPASIVKELIENAVDANATRVVIVTEEGGLQKILVTDNGDGILPEDLKIAFERHATSKLRSEKDLQQIRTLGFRGEALPSISAVAKVCCQSATGETGLGQRIEIHGGQLVRESEVNTPKGTSFTVHDLFYNTPARLKFMKTTQTELSHLADCVNRQALAHPEISFTFTHNGRTLLRTMGNGDVRQVFAAIYGTNSAKEVLAVQAENADYRLCGFTSMPAQTRANRSAITLLVNGRNVRHLGITQALLKAYHTFLPIHRYPLAVLFLSMSPALIDINVHPAKLEVRFSKEKELFLFVEQAIAQTLEEKKGIASGLAGKFAQRTQKEGPANITLDNQVQRLEANPAVFSPSELTQFQTYAAAPVVKKPNLIHEDAGRKKESYHPSPKPKQAKMDQLVHLLEKDPLKTDSSFPQLHWVGQLLGTYIVAQNEQGLYLIDQHAAHERIQYEYFLLKFATPEKASQQLLLPIPLEFTAAEYEIIRKNIPLCAQTGVDLEAFGGHSFLIRAVPFWFPAGEEQAIVREMIEWIKNEKKVDLPALRDKTAMMCACKSALKGNHYQTREASEHLLARLARCQHPYTCPHGRPIVISFQVYEIEKMFKRVQG